MDRIEDLEAFLAIVEHGNQTAAAKRLRRSLQSVSRSLTSLERSAGVELVRRTTRHSQPTEAGLTFYRRLKPAFDQIRDAKLELSGQRDEPSGVLRVSSPVAFASSLLLPAIGDFMKRHPRVEVELKASDQRVDLFEGGFDLAVRIRELPDSQLRARRIGSLRRVVFAAPSYLRTRGRPTQPSELAQHDCIIRSLEPDGERWPFRVRGRKTAIRVHGRFRTDDAASVRTAAAQGLGIGIAPFWQVRPWLEEGRLELILQEFEAKALPVWAVAPATRMPLAKTRLFIELLAARLKDEPL